MSSDSLGIGTKISLEDDLGIDSDRLLGRIDRYYRFSRRHRIDYSYLDISREGSVVAQRNMIFGDLFIPAGTLVESEFRMAVIKTAYTYSFSRTPRWTWASWRDWPGFISTPTLRA